MLDEAPHLLVKLDKCISFTWRPAKFRYIFAVPFQATYCMCPKLESNLKYICFVAVYFCLWLYFVTHLGVDSEQPHMLQLLMKMLSRICLMWELGIFLLCRNFVLDKMLWLKSPRWLVINYGRGGWWVRKGGWPEFFLARMRAGLKPKNVLQGVAWNFFM